MRHIVEQNRHAERVRPVAIVFAALFAAVARVDHALIGRMVDAARVVLKYRQQPYMVDAHGLELAFHRIDVLKG